MQNLDINGDGVIDKDEFARWYFTGMKPYNDTTRNLLSFKNQTKAIFTLLEKEEILE